MRVGCVSGGLGCGSWLVVWVRVLVRGVGAD